MTSLTKTSKEEKFNTSGHSLMLIPDENILKLKDQFPVFVEAYQSPFIGLMHKDDLTQELLIILASCYQQLNQKVDDNDLALMAIHIKRELFNLPLLHIGEFRIACNRGVNNEYPEKGDPVTLSLVRIRHWLKCYRQSPERKLFLVEKEKLSPPKPIPTVDERFSTARDNAVRALGYKKLGRDFSILGVSVYDFLKEIGLISFTKDERWKFWEEAIEEYQKILKERKSKESDDIKRMEIVKALEIVAAGGDPLKIHDANASIANISKRRALNWFFDGIIMNGDDLQSLIEEKKELYMQLKNSIQDE